MCVQIPYELVVQLPSRSFDERKARQQEWLLVIRSACQSAVRQRADRPASALDVNRAEHSVGRGSEPARPQCWQEGPRRPDFGLGQVVGQGRYVAGDCCRHLHPRRHLRRYLLLQVPSCCQQLSTSIHTRFIMLYMPILNIPILTHGGMCVTFAAVSTLQ